MILHRVVFQAKFGKADDVVTMLKEGISHMPREVMGVYEPRILTDISGSFDTVILETVHESLATYEKARAALFAMGEESEEPSQMESLVQSGRNEYYTIE